MKKIKVCYVISTLQNCGPVNILYGIVSNMDFDKFDITILTFNPEKQDSRIEDFYSLPLAVVKLTETKHLGPLQIFTRLKCEINKINPDVLHGHCPGSMMMIPFLGKKYHKVFTPHNFPGKHIRLIYGFKKGVVVELIHNLMIGRYERVICCSESVLAAYNRPNDKRFLAIPNGTSMPMWKRNLSEKADLRKMFHFEKDVKYFVYVGRFASGKNIPILVDTFDTLNRNDIKIVMVGTGPLYEYVKNKASKNIILTGYTTRVSDYLKAADFYISTSDSEGMPNTLLENMSIGNPMLLSTIPAHKEILSNFNDNEVGFLIDQHNVDDIKDRINSILKLDSESVAHIEQEVFLKKYTSKVMSEKYQKAYKELLSKDV